MNLKNQIYQRCLLQIEQNIQMQQNSIDNAQETSQSDTKSSAGDKYETTRAMMQIEIENNTKRLQEAQQQQKILSQINWQETFINVNLGSLVMTNQGTFFVAVGIGQLKLDEQKYFVISPQSPIGALLMHKKVGDAFVFMQKNYEVLEIL